MFTEINAALQSLRVLADLIKAQTSLKNSNEWNMAVFDMQAKLMAVQSVALELQEQNATLSEDVSDLKKRMVEMKDWNRETERYQLAEIATGAFAYSVKPGMERGEPSHHLCANCFTKGEKSILQADAPGVHRTTYRCLRCKSEIISGHRSSGGSKTLMRR